MTAFSNNTPKTSAIKAKKPIRKRPPRRKLPEDLTDFYIADGECPSVLDVVGGRGGASNHHEGNKRYWRRILAERPGYKQLGKHDNPKKNEIAQDIYDYILSTGGRFLQLDPKTQKWFNLPQKIGLDKVKQALRDKYVPNFLEGEPVSVTIAPLLAPLPTLSAPTEGEKKQFLAFLNQAPVTPEADFISGTPSIDLAPIFDQPSLDAWTRFPAENQNKMNSFGFNPRGDSLDSLLWGDLIATCDNIPQVESTVPQAPESLQALLNERMESAIPSSRSFAAV